MNDSGALNQSGLSGKINRGFPGSTLSLTSVFPQKKNKKKVKGKSQTKVKSRKVEQLVRLPFLEETKSNDEVEQNYKEKLVSSIVSK